MNDLSLNRSLGGRRQDSAERDDEGFPIAPAAREHSMTFGRKPVDSRTGAAPTVLLALPSRRNLAGGCEPVQGGVERAFFELEQPAAADFQTPQNLQPMRFAAFERGEDQHLKMAAELIAADWFHAQI